MEKQRPATSMLCLVESFTKSQNDNMVTFSMINIYFKIIMMMMTIDSEYGAQSAASAACYPAAVQKGLSFMTPILMHGVCLT